MATRAAKKARLDSDLQEVAEAWQSDQVAEESRGRCELLLALIEEVCGNRVVSDFAFFFLFPRFLSSSLVLVASNTPPFWSCSHAQQRPLWSC